jgi:DNA topoisomerase IB
MHAATATVTSNSRPRFVRVSRVASAKRVATSRAEAAEATPAEAQAATDAGLHYVSDTEPGLRRRRAGKGFVYLDAKGKRITDAATVERIRALAIPPAYTDVWFC